MILSILSYPAPSKKKRERIKKHKKVMFEEIFQIRFIKARFTIFGQNKVCFGRFFFSFFRTRIKISMQFFCTTFIKNLVEIHVFFQSEIFILNFASSDAEYMSCQANLAVIFITTQSSETIFLVIF